MGDWREEKKRKEKTLAFPDLAFTFLFFLLFPISVYLSCSPRQATIKCVAASILSDSPGSTFPVRPHSPLLAIITFQEQCSWAGSVSASAACPDPERWEWGRRAGSVAEAKAKAGADSYSSCCRIPFRENRQKIISGQGENEK